MEVGSPKIKVIAYLRFAEGRVSIPASVIRPLSRLPCLTTNSEVPSDDPRGRARYVPHVVTSHKSVTFIGLDYSQIRPF